MKNIHVLPTDKPSRLFIDIEDNKLKITIPIGGKHMMNQNIYITNDEEIKEGDYCISHLNIIDEGKIHNSQTIFNPKTKEHLILLQSCKKIILTTNTDLIKDGVQAIDDEFLEWFVKNPSCEEVKWSAYPISPNGNIVATNRPYPFEGLISNFKIEYKIIIPKEVQCTCKEHDPYCCQIHSNCPTCVKKEEPKQETLEEDDLKIPSKFCIPHKHYISDDDKICYETGYKDGIKWMQERMYSEQEVNDLLEVLKRSISEINHLKYTYKDKGHCGKYLSDCETIIEQFKKK